MDLLPYGRYTRSPDVEVAKAGRRQAQSRRPHEMSVLICNTISRLRLHDTATFVPFTGVRTPRESPRQIVRRVATRDTYLVHAAAEKIVDFTVAALITIVVSLPTG